MIDFDSIDAESLRRRRAAKWASAAGDYLSASIADMDFPVAEPIARTLEEMIRASDLGYPQAPAADGLATIFAERMRNRFAWDVDPERVEVLTDVVQGLHLAIGAYSETGDALITPTPVYPPFLDALRATRRVPVWMRFDSTSDGHRIDLDRLRRELLPETRMLLLCNPHNPTGRVLTANELQSLAAIALERDLVIVADEIHADLVYPGAQHIPIASLGTDVAERTVTLSSATKAFNIAGLRCSVAVFGSADLQRRFKGVVDRHVRGGLNTLGLAATAAAWTEGQAWQDEVLRYLDANRSFVASFVRERWPGVVHTPPEATYLSWLDFRAFGYSPSPYAFFAANAHVLLAPGEEFGDEGRGYARLNFATPRRVLEEILGRMDAAMEKRGR